MFASLISLIITNYVYVAAFSKIPPKALFRNLMQGQLQFTLWCLRDKTGSTNGMAKQSKTQNTLPENMVLDTKWKITNEKKILINYICAKLNSAKHTKTYREEVNNNLKWAKDIFVSEEFTQAPIRLNGGHLLFVLQMLIPKSRCQEDHHPRESFYVAPFVCPTNCLRTMSILGIPWWWIFLFSPYMTLGIVCSLHIPSYYSILFIDEFPSQCYFS